MYSLLTLLCLVFMVMWPAIANIFAYPVSKKISLKISDYIVNVCAPRLFAILKKYRNFNFWGYNETKKDLPENFIVISNHQSLLDIPLFMKFFSWKTGSFCCKGYFGASYPTCF